MLRRLFLTHTQHLCSAPPFGQAVEEGAAKKVFDLSLTELGPYSLDFTRNGRHMVLGGRKGHLAMLDWQRSQIVCELQVGGWVGEFGGGRAWGHGLWVGLAVGDQCHGTHAEGARLDAE